MITADNEGNQQVIKELASAVTTQAQVANRVWLGLMTVAVIALLPRTSAGEVALPFGFGKVDATSFHVILFLMLFVLTIAFSSAYAQQFRAQKLAQSFVDSALKSPTSYAGAHPRDRFDMLRLPSFNRVAPLGQLVLGQHQFYTLAGSCPRWRRVTGTVYYLLLKLTSLIVYFGLPGFALFHSCKETWNVASLRWPVTLAAVLAASTLAHVCIIDVLAGLRNVVPQLWTGYMRN
jgi:hypothetical protein